MNILYLNTTYQCGGAEKVTFQLFQGMRRRGHQVYEIVCYDMRDSKLPKQVHVIYGSRCMRIFNRIITGNHGNKSLHIWYSMQYIRSFIKKHQIDVVHLNNPHGNFLGIWDITELAGMCPVVWTLHDFWAMTGHCASPYGCKTLWKEGCAVCSCLENYPVLRKDEAGRLLREKQQAFRKHRIWFTVPSQWMKQQFENSHLAGLPCERVYNSLDTKLWKPLNKQEVRARYQIDFSGKVLGFIAADPGKELKGMKILLEALGKLPDPEQYLLLVAGQKSDALDCLNAEFQVWHLGYLRTQKELNEFYAMADLLVNPSMYETFGLTNIEAMACGTPVVALPVCTMPEVIDDSCGWLAPEAGPGALAETIRRAFEEPVLLEKKGKESRRKAEAVFAEEEMLNRFEAIYHKI